MTSKRRATGPTAIKLLDERTINQIAAGEVIERPASVVKELLENSLDAGTTRLEIRLREGGKELVSVRDNGHGMERGDLLLAFRKHATSKISQLKDLEQVVSFGFRGEALASIGSVARVRALSRTAEQSIGTQLLLEGGHIGSVQEVGAPQGTLIEVVELFYNVPAREKYLKTKATELRHCLAVVTELALAHPEVAFKVEHDGRQLMNVPAGGEERVRLGTLLGKDIPRELIPVSFQSTRLAIQGWVGKPALMRKTGGAIHIFVNDRPVQLPALLRVLREAYGNLMPPQHFPVAVLKVTIAPELVDVNVHPAKRVVRFVDEGQLYRAVQEAVQSALAEHELIPHLNLPGVQKSLPPDDVFANGPPKWDEAGATAQGGSGPGTSLQTQAQLDVNAPDQVLPPASTLPHMEPVGLLDRRYILALGPEAVYLIDYHAAHERVMYERLRLAHRYAKVASQRLLEPKTMDLTPVETTLLQEHLGEIGSLGFDMEHFGGNSFVVRAVPSILGKVTDEQYLKEALSELAVGSKVKGLSERIDGYLYTVACHAALRAGTELTLAHQKRLLAEMAEISNPYACVHGRPTVMVISASELDTKFKRKGF